MTGATPFVTHGVCRIDVTTGAFGGDVTLEPIDFQATATATATAPGALSNAPSDGDWSEGFLNAAGLAAIDPDGSIQMRIYLELDDDDFIGYYSGDHGNLANHPQQVISYQE